MVWYSHLFQNFPQFIVIHTVKGFGIVSKAEIDVFLELTSAQILPAMQEMLVQFWVGKFPWRRDMRPTTVFLGFPGGSAGKESACSVGDVRETWVFT